MTLSQFAEMAVLGITMLFVAYLDFVRYLDRFHTTGNERPKAERSTFIHRQGRRSKLSDRRPTTAGGLPVPISGAGARRAQAAVRVASHATSARFHAASGKDGSTAALKCPTSLPDSSPDSEVRRRPIALP
jgi:hypothetical protein